MGYIFAVSKVPNSRGRTRNKGPALPSPAVRAPDTHTAASEGLYWEISADKPCRSSSSATGPPASWEEASPSRAPSDISQSTANFFQVQSCSWPPPGYEQPRSGVPARVGVLPAPLPREARRSQSESPSNLQECRSVWICLGNWTKSPHHA